jgi:hypothetical protein
VNGFVSATKHRRNLVDAQQCICVEDESEKHLSCGEVLFVKWRSMGVYWLKFTIMTPNSVVFFPRHNTLVTAARTGYILPELLELPLNAGIERPGVDLDNPVLDQLPKHPAKRWLILMENNTLILDTLT